VNVDSDLLSFPLMILNAQAQILSNSPKYQQLENGKKSEETFSVCLYVCMCVCMHTCIWPMMTSDFKAQTWSPRSTMLLRDHKNMYIYTQRTLRLTDKYTSTTHAHTVRRATRSTMLSTESSSCTSTAQ